MLALTGLQGHGKPIGEGGADAGNTVCRFRIGFGGVHGDGQGAIGSLSDTLKVGARIDVADTVQAFQVDGDVCYFVALVVG